MSVLIVESPNLFPGSSEVMVELEDGSRVLFRVWYPADHAGPLDKAARLERIEKATAVLSDSAKPEGYLTQCGRCGRKERPNCPTGLPGLHLPWGWIRTPDGTLVCERCPR